MRIPMLYALLCFLLTWSLAKSLLPLFARLQFAQPIKNEAPQSHQKKQGVLTMGGLFFIIVVSMTLALTNQLTLAFLMALMGLGSIGFIDDLLKIRRKHNDGLSGKQKLLASMIITFALAALGYMDLHTQLSESLNTYPFSSHLLLKTGPFYIPILGFFFTYTVHAVNLTDGIDGLCATVSSIVFASLSYIAFTQGHLSTSIIAAAMTGALLGFLIFNSYPAQIIMGDTGSLAIGGALVYICIDLQNPWALAIIGVTYHIEALSVLLQVGYYKLTKRRLFKMAPYHHSLELEGKSEVQIVTYMSVLTLFFCTLYLLF